MNKDPRSSMSHGVGQSERRRIKAKEKGLFDGLSGFSLFGLVGWSVVIPTLAGTALGLWIDYRYPSGHSWTLMLLVGGLLFGCWNAWHWIAQEQKRVEEEHDDTKH